MPDPTLQGTALRYAAADLTPAEADAFEARLANDQDARDALAEAVRLSAAAIGQKPPAPDPSFRAVLRARLALRGSRSHPLAWIGLGAATAAVCTLIGLALAEHNAPGTPSLAAPNTAPARAEGAPAPHTPEQRVTTTAPLPREAAAPVAEFQTPATCSEDSRTVAEIWADLSTPEHVEKARDDELRWRQHVRNVTNMQHVSATAKAGTTGTADSPQP